MFTNRTRPVDCPVCHGECGEVVETYAGYDGYWGPEVREDWQTCETCAGFGTVERMERLIWAIGEQRKADAADARRRQINKAESLVGSAALYLLKAA